MATQRLDPDYWFKVGILAVVYLAAAKMGLALSVAYGNITPVWAPAGIAIAAVLLFGRSMWVGVALGAFVANATTDIPLWTAGVIAIGNTLEAVVASYLLSRVGFEASLARVRDVLNFVLWGVLAATTVAASFGTVSLLIAGEVPNSRFWFAWSLWWLGDAMGVLLVAPVALAWGRARWKPDSARQLLEAAVLGILVVVVASIVFLGGRWTYPHLLFPLMVWAALRFGQRGASLAVFAASAIGIAGTLDGSVPIGGAALVDSVQILQLLMGLVAISTLVLAAALSERHEAERTLGSSLSVLEATLDATADGILVVDLGARVLSFNQRFVDMWGIPPDIVELRDDDKLLAYVLDQLEDPEQFLARVRELYEHPDSESNDTILFKDGRIVERFSKPQMLGGKAVGRVWSFRDVTRQRALEEDRLRLHDAQAHHQQVLELNDTVVQGLAVARMALELDLADKAEATVVATLETARAIVSDLLIDVENRGGLQPGALIRKEPAIAGDKDTGTS